MVQEIHHLPTHCQMPCLDRDAPNTLQTLLADQTSASKPVQTREETIRKSDLPQLPPPHLNWSPSPHSLPGIFKLKLIFVLRGLAVGGKAGVAAGPPQGSHTMKKKKQNSESHAKEIWSPARPETSSQCHSIAQHLPDGGSGALPLIHRQAWSRDRGKQPSRPPGSQLLMGNAALGPHPKPH